MKPDEALTIASQILGIAFGGLAILGWLSLLAAGAIYASIRHRVRADMTWKEFWVDYYKRHHSPMNTYYNSMMWLHYVGVYRARNPGSLLVKTMWGLAIAGAALWLIPAIRIVTLLVG